MILQKNMQKMRTGIKYSKSLYTISRVVDHSFEDYFYSLSVLQISLKFDYNNGITRRI